MPDTSTCTQSSLYALMMSEAHRAIQQHRPRQLDLWHFREMLWAFTSLVDYDKLQIFEEKLAFFVVCFGPVLVTFSVSGIYSHRIATRCDRSEISLHSIRAFLLMERSLYKVPAIGERVSLLKRPKALTRRLFMQTKSLMASGTATILN